MCALRIGISISSIDIGIGISIGISIDISIGISINISIGISFSMCIGTGCPKKSIPKTKVFNKKS